MIIDFLLAIIFAASTATLWYRISGKLPELIAIPDQVITERFHEDSARLRLFVLNFKTWYKEQHYREAFWRVLVKALYKLHIFLLRLDNGIVALLKGLRESGKVSSVNGNADYWKELQQNSTPTVKDNRIREVRVKK